MNLTEARSKLAALLAPIEDADPNVLESLVDAIEPPALMLGWGEPWLEPDTLCATRGRIVITCVASRLMPGDGLAMLESLVDYALGRLATDPANWTLDNVSGPRVFPIAKTAYLAARIVLRVVID